MLTANPNQIRDALSDAYPRLYRAEQLRLILTLESAMTREDATDGLVNELVSKLDLATERYIDIVCGS